MLLDCGVIVPDSPACSGAHLVRPGDQQCVPASSWRGLADARVVAFEALGTSLTPVQTPVGDAWTLTQDEAAFRAAAGPPAPARRRERDSDRRCPVSSRRSGSGAYPRTAGPSERDAIASRLAGFSVWSMQQATGLSAAARWRIKRGERRAHPRHWEALRALAGDVVNRL